MFPHLWDVRSPAQLSTGQVPRNRLLGSSDAAESPGLEQSSADPAVLGAALIRSKEAEGSGEGRAPEIAAGGLPEPVSQAEVMAINPVRIRDRLAGGHRPA